MWAVLGALIAMSYDGSRDWADRCAAGIHLGPLTCECLLGVCNWHATGSVVSEGSKEASAAGRMQEFSPGFA